MTAPADLARANAISLEVKKDGLYQKKGADWVVRFTLQSADLCDALKDAALGTRYAMVLVEVGDNEEPINGTHPAPGSDANNVVCSPVSTVVRVDSDNAKPQSVTITPAAADDIPGFLQRTRKRLAQQSAICCGDPLFRAFLVDYQCMYDIADKDDAAKCVRYLCNVDTRSALDSDDRAAADWRELHSKFLLWRDYPSISPSHPKRERDMAGVK